MNFAGSRAKDPVGMLLQSTAAGGRLAGVRTQPGKKGFRHMRHRHGLFGDPQPQVVETGFIRHLRRAAELLQQGGAEDAERTGIRRTAQQFRRPVRLIKICFIRIGSCSFAMECEKTGDTAQCRLIRADLRRAEYDVVCCIAACSARQRYRGNLPSRPDLMELGDDAAKLASYPTHTALPLYGDFPGSGDNRCGIDIQQAFKTRTGFLDTVPGAPDFRRLHDAVRIAKRTPAGCHIAFEGENRYGRDAERRRQVACAGVRANGDGAAGEQRSGLTQRKQAGCIEDRRGARCAHGRFP